MMRPHPATLLNMELSELAFEQRVLALAADPQTPLLERVRFLSILGSNIDQFFRTRVAGFQKQRASGSTKRTLDGLTATQQLEQIAPKVREILGDAYRLLWRELVPELGRVGISIPGWQELSEAEREYLREHYLEGLDALLVWKPLRQDLAFPHLRNLRPALLAGDRIAELPGDIPRFVPLPGGLRLIPLEEVIRAALPDPAYTFRVTRSADLNLHALDEDPVGTLQEKLLRRRLGPVVRLEVEAAMPPDSREMLLRGAAPALGPDDVYEVDRLVDLRSLAAIADLPMDEVCYPPVPRHTPLDPHTPVWPQIERGDILFRFPRDDFEASLERLVEEAADDDSVTAVSITLYRTGAPSRLIDLLRRAKRRGKRVLALVELTASFDEQRNIEWARKLEATGIKVVFGPPTLKVHAKVMFIERGASHYGFIGTGNLNAETAAGYTDLGLLTAEPTLCAELAELFRALAQGDLDGLRTARAVEEDGEGHGASPAGAGRRLLVAPVDMRERFLSLIEREAAHGERGRLRVKINGLTDPEMIAALYRASQAGVRCELVVRSICCLRPGVPGLSENISVRSILGRFLEHARIFEFGNGGDPEYFIGSADWRPRNLSRRVEIVTPVRDAGLKAKLGEILTEDLLNPQAWTLLPDGSYERL